MFQGHVVIFFLLRIFWSFFRFRNYFGYFLSSKGIMVIFLGFKDIMVIGEEKKGTINFDIYLSSSLYVF